MIVTSVKDIQKKINLLEFPILVIPWGAEYSKASFWIVLNLAQLLEVFSEALRQAYIAEKVHLVHRPGVGWDKFQCIESPNLG